MHLNQDEEKFILLLGRAYEDGVDISKEELPEKLGISKERCETIVRTLWGRGYFEETVGESGEFISPRQLSLDLARQIRKRHARPKNWVDRYEVLAKSHPWIAVVIVIVKAAGPLVGLIGGVLGIMAFCRSC